MTDSARPSDKSPDDAERRRRLDALRDLARGADDSQAAMQSAPARSAAPAMVLRQPRRGRRWLLAGALVALALIAAVVGVFARGPIAAQLAGHSGPGLASRIVALGDKVGLYCPTSPVWSPDGRQVAVLAQTHSSNGECNDTRSDQWNLMDMLESFDPSGPILDYAIGVIDAATGQVVRVIPFALPTIKALCGAKCALTDFYNPLYASYNPRDAISWSPDGKTVGFFFAYNVNTGKTVINGVQVNGSRFYGALQLIPVSGSGSVRTLLASSFVEPGGDRPYPITLFHSAPIYTWNLSTGASAYSAMPNETGEATTPFAAVYGWTASEQIAPQASASATTFTPWISGQLRTANVTSRVFQYTANLWRWSPDGQYVAPNLTLQAYVRAPGVLDAPPPMDAGYYSPPLVLPPDPAMAALLKEISKPQMSAEVAWSPDGKLLAGLDCQPGADSARLTVRRGNDGGGMVTTTFIYPPTMSSQGCTGDMEALAWSRDDASIATSDAAADEVAIWRYSA